MNFSSWKRSLAEPVAEVKDEVEASSGRVGASAPSGGRYVGEEKDGVPHGRGTLEKDDGSTYVGEFMDGQPNGQGIETSANGEQYIGEFKNGNYHGQGVITFADGKKFTVSGKVSAQDWIKKYGGECEFTGEYEDQSIS